MKFGVFFIGLYSCLKCDEETGIFNVDVVVVVVVAGSFSAYQQRNRLTTCLRVPRFHGSKLRSESKTERGPTNEAGVLIYILNDD